MEDKKQNQEEQNLEEKISETAEDENIVSEDIVDEEAVEEKADEDFNEELEDLKSTLMRLQADFNNYRNRMTKEKADIIRYASQSLIEKLLPVLDNFNRAIESCKEDESIREGFSLIEKDLIKILEDEGLEEIKADGKEFDPNFHNAVVMEESDQPSGTVIETLQRGYKLGDKVLRAPMVKVSK
ncbi:MAG: nucleotide exchange factor GrpE [Tissierellia bacterium]|nr:nucleotide exchange factor GrpE [Tissierellia bacterium]